MQKVLALASLVFLTNGACVDFLNGGYRECCPDTGLCKDSSCTVFGFANSAKANCHTSGANPNCKKSYCNWKVANCTQVDTTNNHCYGTVACTDRSTSCFGYGQLCLEDGNSANFKVCADDCKNNDDCGTDMYCDKQGNLGTCVDISGGPATSAECCPKGSNVCQSLGNQYKEAGYLEYDIPNINYDAVMSILAKYRCTTQSNDCNAVVCSDYVPKEVMAQLRGVQC